MPKDINSKSFTPETQIKLEIFRRYFREWFPVFANTPYSKCLYVYDFFAGSGYDSDGEPGSPIILLQEAKSHCKTIENKGKSVYFTFNEYDKGKCKLLKENVDEYISKCQIENGCDKCIFTKGVINKDFVPMFESNDHIKSVLINKDYSKFIILDQYGFTKVDQNVFNTLINSPRTDFIFFISSSFLRRFQDHPVTKKFLGEFKLPFDETKPKECHRVIAEYFESLIPAGKEYYLNHFTIKKGSNYYGLIMGTSHSLGMEKFQRVCWEVDKLAGESNCNIENDFVPGELFYSENEDTNKITKVKSQLESEILSGKITDNISGLKRALKLRCQPKVFTEVVTALEKSKKIERVGSLNNRSTDIHRIKTDNSDYFKIIICYEDNKD